MPTASDTTLPARVDLLVVGAGTAGAAVAAMAAEEGLSVLCVDRGPLDAAGARWVNGVPRAAFEASGLDAPTGDELRGGGVPFHMLAGWGPERVEVREHGVLEVDMRLLVARLQGLARSRGAVLAGDVEVRGLEGTHVRTSRGDVRAEVIVDASGLAGARLLGQPAPPRTDLCAAAQAVHEVADAAGARAFCERHRIAEGETLCFAGVAGGYSILNVTVHGDEVSILTGSIPADGHPSGAAMLRRFVEEHDWVGPERFGGQRAIPLGRPHDTLAEGRVALVGDAARQVFAAHGSGIGAGLVAARTLVDAVARGAGPEEYAVRWQRRFGGLFAGYDLFRRFSQELSVGALKRLVRTGVLDPETMTAGLVQELPALSASRAARIVPAVARAGRVGGRLARVGARMAALHALYAAYPRRAPRAAWRRAVATIAKD